MLFIIRVKEKPAHPSITKRFYIEFPQQQLHLHPPIDSTEPHEV